MNTIPKDYPFLSEMIEKWPEKFYRFPTAIRLGRALFAPILFLLSQKKHDKNS